MLKYNKNYQMYLDFTEQSRNLTQLEHFCSKRESMAANELKNLAFFISCSLEWLIFWLKSQHFEKLYQMNIKI